MTKADRKEREREWKRNDIVDSAEKLFFSRGYENVTMDDIAREVEMARGTLYLYFKNKDDIYIAIALRGAKILNQMFGESRWKGKTGLERGKSLIQAYYGFYKTYPGYFAAYTHSMMFDHEGDPELEELRRVRTDSFRMVVESFGEGMKDGSVSQDIDPGTNTLVMLFSINSVLNTSPVVRMYMKDFGLTQDELFNRTLGMMLRSVERRP